MNQTKKRLSIIELAISITDIETIQLQMLQLHPLRSDLKIDEILICLEDENYGQAQNLIITYIDEVQETVIQRIQEEATSKDEALFDEYNFLIEPTLEKLENNEEQSTDENNQDEDDIEDEIVNHIATVPHDYTSLLNIQADDVLSDNIQLNVSADCEENMTKEKINFDLETIPKDDFFNENIVFTESMEEPSEDSKVISLTPTTAAQSKDTLYTAIPTIYGQFQDIQIQYPTIYASQGYSDKLETWLKKIAEEGYTEVEVEEILQYIEQLALTDKAQAAQFLLLTAKTESKYAKFILSRALYRGSLLKRNLDESFKIMSYLAFEEKYPEAICDLAQFYENGISITKDKNQAELLYQEAMNLGIKRAVPHYERIVNENKGFFSFLKR